MSRPSGPRRTLISAALALLAVVLAALLVPRLAEGSPAEGSREMQFVRGMLQHHAQAVDLAVRVRDRAGSPTVRTLALDILLSQQEQIGQMHGWLTLWGRPWAGPGMTGAHARSMGMATPQEVARLDTQPPAQAEVTFLQLMVRHHQGALAMSVPVLSAGARPEVQALTRQIQASQAAEIRAMTALLGQRGAQALPAPPSMDMDHQNMP